MPKIETDNLEQFNQKTLADDADFVDANILCIDCGDDFVWTVGEQVFFPR